jgi:hydroxymethylglutaryl-CoA lyase
MPIEPVKLIECPRDAWQGLPRQIPTELKADYLRNLIDAGFKHIDAASFVSPKAVPQMADSEQVLIRVSIPQDVEIIGIVVNEKGADRAIATKRVTTLGFPCSVSPTFLLRNQNQTAEQNLAALTTIKKLADAADIDMVVYLSMAFGNPYGDPWNENEIKTAAARIVELGVQSISLADTIGVADPDLIGRIVPAVIHAARDCEVGVHLHSTRAEAGRKVLAAYDVGCRRFDSALGGLGGCPFAQDALVGNIPSESVIAALGERGIKLPLETGKVLQLNAEIAADFA